MIDIDRMDYHDKCMSGDPCVQDIDWIEVGGEVYHVDTRLPDGRVIIQAYAHPESSCAWILTVNADGGLFEESWDEYDGYGVIPF